MREIPVTRPSLPSLEEYARLLAPSWQKGILTNMGDNHQRLEKELTHRLGSNTLLFSSGHAALEGALDSLELAGEVITTPFTFASTAHAIKRRGLTPVFCDIEPGSLTLDPDRAAALITEKTAALLPVHVYGNMCDVERLGTLCRKNGLKLLYDCAHAFGSTYNGNPAAHYGDMCAFSFHATKPFTTGEGGAVTFSEQGCAQRLRDCRNFGIRGEETVTYPGGNGKLSELHAALGLWSLEHFDEHLQMRRGVYGCYMDALETLGVRRKITFPVTRRGVETNYGYFPVFFRDGVCRDRVYAALRAGGVTARKYFYPLVSQGACYGLDGRATPIALDACFRVLCLPMYAELGHEDVYAVCKIISEAI